MNHDDAPQEYAGMILADFERLRPKYVFLWTELDARIADVAARAPELVASPKRAENYRRAYLQIEAYVRSHYVAAERVGRETVYLRREPAP